MRYVLLALLLGGCAGSQFRGESPNTAMCFYAEPMGYQCIGGPGNKPVGPSSQGSFAP
jgi:hypothetical protein